MQEVLIANQEQIGQKFTVLCNTVLIFHFQGKFVLQFCLKQRSKRIKEKQLQQRKLPTLFFVVVLSQLILCYFAFSSAFSRLIRNEQRFNPEYFALTESNTAKGIPVPPQYVFKEPPKVIATQAENKAYSSNEGPQVTVIRLKD